jgi:hypothetical protein
MCGNRLLNFTATAVPTNQPIDNAYKLSTIAAKSELGVPNLHIKRIGGRNPKFRQWIYGYRLVARPVSDQQKTLKKGFRSDINVHRFCGCPLNGSNRMLSWQQKLKAADLR